MTDDNPFDFSAFRPPTAPPPGNPGPPGFGGPGGASAPGANAPRNAPGAPGGSGRDPSGREGFGSAPFGPTDAFGPPRSFGTAAPEQRWGDTTVISGGPVADAPASAGRPLVWLTAALVVAVVALAAGAVPVSGGTVYIIGWALAGPVAFGLLTVFARSVATAHSVPSYSYPAWQPRVYQFAWVLALLAVLLNALRIANWAGRL